jgi:hypothetical protein
MCGHVASTLQIHLTGLKLRAVSWSDLTSCSSPAIKTTTNSNTNYHLALIICYRMPTVFTVESVLLLCAICEGATTYTATSPTIDIVTSAHRTLPKRNLTLCNSLHHSALATNPRLILAELLRFRDLRPPHASTYFAHTKSILPVAFEFYVLSLYPTHLHTLFTTTQSRQCNLNGRAGLPPSLATHLHLSQRHTFTIGNAKSRRQYQRRSALATLLATTIATPSLQVQYQMDEKISDITGEMRERESGMWADSKNHSDPTAQQSLEAIKRRAEAASFDKRTGPSSVPVELRDQVTATQRVLALITGLADTSIGTWIWSFSELSLACLYADLH